MHSTKIIAFSKCPAPVGPKYAAVAVGKESTVAERRQLGDLVATSIIEHEASVWDN